MNQENQIPEKRKRARRSAEKMAELVLEAERVGAAPPNVRIDVASEICILEGRKVSLTNGTSRLLRGI